MRCGVITPIGPGHEEAYQKASKSIQEAIQTSTGPFEEVVLLAMDDTRGEMGRSVARNKAIAQAVEEKIDWLFFLDADDYMLPDCFKQAENYVNQLDAFWGLIVEASPDIPQPMLRQPQIHSLCSVQEVVLFDPYITLQMGHFVKTEIAAENLFRTDLDAGEDFEYYLRVWSKYRCAKVPVCFFVNIRGNHSTGPRSADGRQWRANVEGVLAQYRKAYKMDVSSTKKLELQNQKALEAREYICNNPFADERGYQLAQHYFPYHGYVDITDEYGTQFVMYSNNDEPVVKEHFWKKATPLSVQLVNILAARSNTIIDIGSYTGRHAISAKSVRPKATVYAVEPLPENTSRLFLNARTNNTEVIHLPFAISNGNGVAYWQEDQQTLNPNAFITRQKTSDQVIQVETFSLDYLMEGMKIEAFDLVVIDTGNEAEVLAGAAKILDQKDCDIIVRINSPESARVIEQLIKDKGFSCYHFTNSATSLFAVKELTSWLGEKDYCHLLTKRSLRRLQQIFRRTQVNIFESDSLKALAQSSLKYNIDEICIEDTIFTVAEHWFWKEFKHTDWEPDTYNIFKKYMTTETEFVDIGAWVGVTSMFADKLGCKKIHAIEANPNTYDLLNQTIRMNDSLTKKMSLTNICITDKENDVVSFGTSTSSASKISDNGEYKVKTTTLGSFFNNIDYKNKEKLFVKIDIEGAELLILEDLLKIAQHPDIRFFLALHPPFWSDKEAGCEKLLKALQNFNIKDPKENDLDIETLRDMILTKEEKPAWGTPFGNFFEILLIPKK